MLLRIQSDESLRSFIARNLFLNWSGPQAKVLDRLSKSVVTSYDVKIIAAAMGWFGCYGFNRLLHYHTFYPRLSVFKRRQDISYSHTEYLTFSHHLESDRISASFCPECVKEDLAALGYSYWRRVPRWDIKVCAKHNIYLVDRCPFCGVPFGYRGHSLDVMWSGCGGRYLGEAFSLRNEDPSELKKAKLFQDAFNCGFVLSIEAVLLVVRERFLTFDASAQRLDTRAVERLSTEISHVIKVIEEHTAENNASLFDEYSGLVWESVLLLYDGFSQFLNDLELYGYDPRPVCSLWSTYRAGGSESAHYVEEDYLYGVGHWSCPYPSSLSQQTRYSNDGFGRPTLYPCCNFPSPRRKGHQLKPKWVRPPPPVVPLLAEHLAQEQAETRVSE